MNLLRPRIVAFLVCDFGTLGTAHHGMFAEDNPQAIPRSIPLELSIHGSVAKLFHDDNL